MSREEQIDAWLSEVLGESYRSREPASEDASFRRYLRVYTGDWALVLMDAPPETENCQAFVRMNSRLREAGLPAPKLYAADLDRGFVLLEDLGDACLLGHDDDEALLDRAIELLVRMQSRVPSDDLEPYAPERLRTELGLFPEWFLDRHLGLTLDAEARETFEHASQALVGACLEQPQVFTHRDYHSRNLMVRPGQGLAIIDHQDAVHGPLLYDVVSLLRDVYVRRAGAEVERGAQRYAELARTAGLPVPGERDALMRWLDLTGAQRHLKIAGIFARLYHRDGKTRYLPDIPLTLDYLAEECAARTELAALGALLERLEVADRARAANARATEGGAR